MNIGRNALWASGEAYERYMGRWSRKIAPQFLDWLRPRTGADWIDIGCGTGVLSAAILERSLPGTVVGVDPSEPFVAFAQTAVQDARFACRLGRAEALATADHTFDYAVSGLTLNFVSDPRQAATEMARVLRPGGRAALYVWDYAGHMQIMRRFFDVATASDPAASDYDDGVKAPICRPTPLRRLFEDAGLTDVAVEAIDTPAAFKDFDDYWAPFLGGTGSAPKYLASLPADAQTELKSRVRSRLPTGPDGEILLAIRAWAVAGNTPE